LAEVAGLFAGIGGLEHGFADAGLHSGLLAEIDPSARSILVEKFPKAVICDDVTMLERIPADTRILTAGFPCQDLSAPGGKAGIAGTRSGLVSHVFRLLRDAPAVEWLVLENVPFMLRLDTGAAMSSLVDRLDELGWNWAYRTVDAICVVPQRRRRVVLVASPCHDPSEVLFGNDHPAPDERSWTRGETVGFYWTEGRSGSGLRREAVPTLKVGSSLGIPSAPAILDGSGKLGMPGIRDAEALQGFPRGWTDTAQHAARGARWKLVGNAVPPPLAAWVAHSINTPPGVACTVKFETLVLRGGWPGAACGDRDRRFAVKIGEAFSSRPRPLLSALIADPLTKLSARAVGGFLSRARTGGMRWPSGFLDQVAANA
jgi:DNA (cytosine-5)-methyltransferase 1